MELYDCKYTLSMCLMLERNRFLQIIKEKLVEFYDCKYTLFMVNGKKKQIPYKIKHSSAFLITLYFDLYNAFLYINLETKCTITLITVHTCSILTYQPHYKKFDSTTSANPKVWIYGNIYRKHQCENLEDWTQIKSYVKL